MLKKYEKFLKEFDKKIAKYFKQQSEYICCKEGCSGCCEVGDYPFTQLEMMYLMEGYKKLPRNLQLFIRNNLMQIKSNRVSTHLFYKCPFLVDNKCSVYSHRGITCRTFGLAYLSKKIVKLPECVHQNLCFSKVYENNELLIEPIKEDLNLLEITSSKLAQKYKLDFGPSRSLIDWFP
jgi:Fe-S-cluster containining protein